MSFLADLFVRRTWPVSAALWILLHTVTDLVPLSFHLTIDISSQTAKSDCSVAIYLQVKY